MKSRYIRTLAAVRQDDINEVGGKGAALGELLGHGFPVPAGFMVTTEAYTHFLGSLRLEKVLHSLNHAGAGELNRSCGIIRNTITNASFPGKLAEAILAAHERLVDSRADLLCAVRSSATTEDLAGASFAGQHATYYYVERANLLRMIQYCWASLWNPEAVSYRNACGIEHGSAMAVLVQELVQAEISGLTFTANPVTGEKEIIVEASWGMGAAIVDGRVTPDRYTLDHKTLQLRNRQIAEKRFMVPCRLKSKAASRLLEVPPEMQHQEALTPEFIRTAAEWAAKAEQHFGVPQDVEWAIADGQFYLLQSRPITVPGNREKIQAPEGQYVLFKPAVENLTDPFTPLTADLISLASAPLLRFIHGRCYLDLKYIRPVFPFNIADHELVDLFYGLSSEVHLPLRRFSFLQLPLFLVTWLCGYLIFGIFFARTRNMPDNFMEHYRTLCRDVEHDTAYNPFTAILRLSFLPKLYDPIGRIPLWVNASAARYVLCFGPLKVLFRHWLPDAPSDALTVLCSGQEGVLSAEMGLELQELARAAAQNDDVRDLLLHSPPRQVLTELGKKPEARTFLQIFDKFLAKHRHRALKELELQSARWEENPTQLIGMLRNYLLTDVDRNRKGDASEKTSVQERHELEAGLQQQLDRLPFERLFRPRGRLLHFLFRRIRYLIKLRENSRCYHIMAMSVVRKKLLEIEEKLLAQGSLRCRGDIFFLKLRETLDMQKGVLKWPDIEARIYQRRLEYLRAVRHSPSKAIGVHLPADRQAERYYGNTIVLAGQTASPGSYTGRARVIMDPSKDPELRPGEILVAPYTDPTWTPLFLTAGGAVVEVGSYLSHAGTVAREYGLPCVVDVTGCTRRIHTGDLLFIDGEQGLVRILVDQKKAEQNQ
ncbi:MAG: PEP/pyruvate-binding domain-containing protein [Candidatus Electrothrix sp. YB6]